MRRWMVMFLILGMLFTVAGSLQAEVQNVRLGGDIRTRFYFTKNLWDLDSETDDEDFYIRQRSRVSSEADLTDNVWAVATVEADGIWGQEMVVPYEEAETEDIGWTRSVNDWDVSIAEAYIKLSEIFYSPMTLKLGRQYLHYGRGFLISSREWEYKFDAARVIFDFYPWTIDLLYSRLVESDQYEPLYEGAAPKAADDEDLFGANFKYEEDLWTLEGYVFGIRDAFDMEYGDNKNGPVAVGIRGDASPVEAFDIWGEFVYEFGSYQTPLMTESSDINALAFDAGAVYVFDVTWEPAIAVSYTFASGDDEADDKYETFNPLYNYNYYGYAFSPRLSNIGIGNAQLSVLPSEDTTLVLDLFYYMQDKQLVMSMGDPTQDNGGVSTETSGQDKDLGMELDFIFEYNYTEDVSTQLVLAWFKPGDAYKYTDPETGIETDPDDVFEIRAEIMLNF